MNWLMYVHVQSVFVSIYAPSVYKEFKYMHGLFYFTPDLYIHVHYLYMHY